MIFSRLKQIDIKSIAQMTFTAFFSGIFPLLFEPFFKSNFSTEEYGSYALFMQFTMIFALLMTFKTETMLSSSKKENIKEYFNNSIILSITNFIVFTIIYTLIVFCTSIKPILTIYYALISGLIFSLINVTITFLLRQNESLYVSLQKPIRRFFEVFLLIVFIFSIKLPHALELSTIFGLLMSFLPLLKKSGLSINSLNFDIKNQLKLINKSKSILFGEVLNSISISFLSFFVYINYSIGDLGVLDLSFKLISIPQLLICSVLAIVIQNNIGKLVSENKSIIRNVKSYFYFLLIISLIFTITLYYGSDFIISKLFEKQWYQSSTYTIALLPHLFFFVIFSPLSRVLYAMMENKIIRNWQFLKLVIITSTVFFYWLDISDFLIIYSIFSSISYVVLSIFLFKTIIKYEKKLII